MYVGYWKMFFTKYHVCIAVFFILHMIDGSNQKQTKPYLSGDISKVTNELDKPQVVNRRKLGINNILRYSNGNWETGDPIIERICKKTGCSCGRSGLLCDAQDVFDVANDVSDVINNIERQTDKDGNTNEFNDLLRCGTRGCMRLSDQQEKASDTFTEDFNLDSVEENATSENQQTVLSEFNDITIPRKQEYHRLSTRVALKPEDIYEHYRSAMDQIRETLLGFIKYRTGLRTVRSLPPDVRKGIQAIRDRYRHYKMSDKSLKQQIFQVLLNDILKIKIVPNRNPDNNYGVFIPDWMFYEVLKKREGNQLRGQLPLQKRVLPLTFQQKIRLQNNLGPKKLLKFVWRRNLGSDISQYGVPFTLNIHGLGQLN